MTLRAVPAGTPVPGRSNHAELVEGSRPDKEQSLVLQVGGWAVGQSPASLKPSRLQWGHCGTLLRKSKHDTLGTKSRGCSEADQTTSDPEDSAWNRELERKNYVRYREIRTSCKSDGSDEDPNYGNN